MFIKVEDILIAQSIASAIVLILFLVLLVRKGLFNWTSAGFWSWIAFAIYFFLSPLASVWWNLDKYLFSIQLIGGLDRAAWIGVVSIIGMVVFFISYLRTKTRPVTWKLEPNDQRITFIMAMIMVVFAILSAISLFTYHLGDSSVQDQAVRSGRFTGDVTGYQYIAQNFIFVPIAISLLSRSRFLQLLGLAVGAGYVILRMSDEWGRWSIISMLFTISLAITLLRKKKWPPAIFLIAIILFAGVLTVRGHTSVNSRDNFMQLVMEIPEKIGRKFTRNNTDMLAFWYIDSYIKDSITGYDLGIPLLNYAVTGFIPSRFFPDKYFLINWLASKQPPLLDQQLLSTLFGSKPTLLGSFYGHGGVIGVILFAWIFGIILRKMDGMLSPQSPMLVKAIGIIWLSTLWMVWGSQDSWALSTLGSLAMPLIVLWIVAPKFKKGTKFLSDLSNVSNVSDHP